MIKDFQDVYVSESKIHGFGVFAKKKFLKGEQVLVWKPKIINEEELNRLNNKEKTYISEFGGVLKLMQEPERFVNYSIANNTTPNELGDVATRDIEIGEEITSDYNGENVDTTNFN
jgi:SET domain-containing protein